MRKAEVEVTVMTATADAAGQASMMMHEAIFDCCCCAHAVVGMSAQMFSLGTHAQQQHHPNVTAETMGQRIQPIMEMVTNATLDLRMSPAEFMAAAGGVLALVAAQMKPCARAEDHPALFPMGVK